MKYKMYCGCLLAVVILMGCEHKNTATEVAIAQPVETKAVPTRAKPGAAVSLISKNQKISAGINTALNLSLQVLSNSGQLSIAISLPENLALVSGETNVAFDLNSVTSPLSIPLVVNGHIDGKYYITLQATLENNEGKSYRSLSQIIWVGDVIPTAKSKNSASGGVKVMPATETIKSAGDR